MSRIDFYHLQKQTLEEVLPRLIEKAYATGSKIKIKVGNEERVEFINALLWTFSDEAFIPHGSKKDGFAANQPIWLSSDDDNPNNAEMLFLVDGAKFDLAQAENYTRIFNIFDGNDENSLQQARKFWKDIAAAGGEKNYFQQDSNGRWNKKA